jgi:small subunit ribosomal protein S17
MPRRVMQGEVVSDKGDKTVVVLVERTFLHPILKKTVRRSKRFHAHDETNSFKVGDLVAIQECPPRSKLKNWEVLSRVGADKAG